MNVASRMMSTGEDGRIQCSQRSAVGMCEQGLEQHGLRVSRRGQVAVKGKGLMETFWLNHVPSQRSALSTPDDLGASSSAYSRMYQPVLSSHYELSPPLQAAISTSTIVDVSSASSAPTPNLNISKGETLKHSTREMGLRIRAPEYSRDVAARFETPTLLPGAISTPMIPSHGSSATRAPPTDRKLKFRQDFPAIAMLPQGMHAQAVSDDRRRLGSDTTALLTAASNARNHKPLRAGSFALQVLRRADELDAVTPGKHLLRRGSLADVYVSRAMGSGSPYLVEPAHAPLSTRIDAETKPRSQNSLPSLQELTLLQAGSTLDAKLRSSAVAHLVACSIPLATATRVQNADIQEALKVPESPLEASPVANVESAKAYINAVDAMSTETSSLDGLRRSVTGIVASAPTSITERIANTTAIARDLIESIVTRSSIHLNQDVSAEDDTPTTKSTAVSSGSGVASSSSGRSRQHRNGSHGYRAASPSDYSTGPNQQTYDAASVGMTYSASVQVEQRASICAAQSNELATPAPTPTVSAIFLSLLRSLSHYFPTLVFLESPAEAEIVWRLLNKAVKYTSMWSAAFSVVWIIFGFLYLNVAVGSTIFLVIPLGSAAMSLMLALLGRFVFLPLLHRRQPSLRPVATIRKLLFVYLTLHYTAAVAYLLLLPQQHIYSSTMPIEHQIMWSTAFLALLSLSQIFWRLPAVESVAYAIATLLVDLCWLIDVSFRRNLPGDVAAISIASLCVFRVFFVWSAYAFEYSERSVYASHRAVTAADKDSKALLRNLFPATVVASLVRGEAVPPRSCSDVAVLYADLVGFTKLGSSMSSSEVMGILNVVYSRFDELVEAAGLWKVDTVGDAYIVVCGLPELVSPPSSEHTDDGGSCSDVGMNDSLMMGPLSRDLCFGTSGESAARQNIDKVLRLASRLLTELRHFREHLGLPLHMRIGVHCGEVVTGMVGSARPRFCVLGSALVEAEDAEANGQLDRVTCTEAAREKYLASSFSFSELSTCPNRYNVDLL